MYEEIDFQSTKDTWNFRARVYISNGESPCRTQSIRKMLRCIHRRRNTLRKHSHLCLNKFSSSCFGYTVVRCLSVNFHRSRMFRLRMLSILNSPIAEEKRRLLTGPTGVAFA